jgi:hypothetical protein
VITKRSSHFPFITLISWSSESSSGDLNFNSTDERTFNLIEIALNLINYVILLNCLFFVILLRGQVSFRLRIEDRILSY